MITYDTALKTPLLLHGGLLVGYMDLVTAIGSCFHLLSSYHTGPQDETVVTDELPYPLFLTLGHQHDQHVECVASLGSRAALLACKSY